MEAEKKKRKQRSDAGKARKKQRMVLSARSVTYLASIVERTNEVLEHFPKTSIENAVRIGMIMIDRKKEFSHAR